METTIVGAYICLLQSIPMEPLIDIYGELFTRESWIKKYCNFHKFENEVSYIEICLCQLYWMNFQKVSSKDIPDFMTPQEGITYSRDVLYYLPNKVNMNSAK